MTRTASRGSRYQEDPESLDAPRGAQTAHNTRDRNPCTNGLRSGGATAIPRTYGGPTDRSNVRTARRGQGPGLLVPPPPQPSDLAGGSSSVLVGQDRDRILRISEDVVTPCRYVVAAPAEKGKSKHRQFSRGPAVELRMGKVGSRNGGLLLRVLAGLRSSLASVVPLVACSVLRGGRAVNTEQSGGQGERAGKQGRSLVFASPPPPPRPSVPCPAERIRRNIAKGTMDGRDR